MSNKNLQDYKYCEKVIELKQTIETSFLLLGEKLLHIREKQLYLSHGETFEDFLEVAKITPGTASKLINIFQKFILQWEFTPEKLVEAGGWSLVATIMPICKTKDDAEKWLHEASIKSRTDLERDLREERTGISMVTCEHEDTYNVEICKECGIRLRKYED